MRRIPLKLTKSVPLTIFRKTQGEYVHGEFKEGEITEVTIKVNIQPLLDKDRTKMQPEGWMNRGGFKIYTNDLMREKKEGKGGWDADTFVWENEEYEVMQVIKYSMGILDHYKVIALQKPRARI